jgi:hypothetical protein
MSMSDGWAQIWEFTSNDWAQKYKRGEDPYFGPEQSKGQRIRCEFIHISGDLPSEAGDPCLYFYLYLTL